jgi:hypothetical protein
MSPSSSVVRVLVARLGNEFPWFVRERIERGRNKAGGKLSGGSPIVETYVQVPLYIAITSLDSCRYTISL